jgi:hypothetical protein
VTTTLTVTRPAPVPAPGLREVLEADFARARRAWSQARVRQAGKDTPAHRAAVAEAAARIDAVLDMHLEARAAR